MSFIPNWSPTAYYNLGDSVFYTDTQYRLQVAGSTPGVFGVTPPANPSAWAVIPAVAFSYNYYVSNVSGNDTTGDGTITNPYQTIGKAITTANGISDSNRVSIFLASGTYTENVVVVRANTFINGSATSLSTATNIVGSVTIDMTASTLPFIIGGLSSLQVSNIVFNNAVSNSQSYLVTDCLISPPLGRSAIVMTDTSVGGVGDLTIQSCLIYMSDLTAVTNSNGFITFVNTEIKNNPLITSPNTMLRSSGSGSLNMLGCVVSQNSTLSTVQPIINLTNNVTTTRMTFSNNTIQYLSAVSDAGTGGKCCIRCSNSASINPIILFNNLLLCQGATTTNGTPGQFVVLQRTGAGSVVVNQGQNSGGTTANHLPPNGGGFTKVAYVNVA